MPSGSVEAGGVAGRVLMVMPMVMALRVCRVTAGYNRKYDGRTWPDIAYNFDCYNWAYFF